MLYKLLYEKFNGQGQGRALLPGGSPYPAITSSLVSSSVCASPDPAACTSP